MRSALELHRDYSRRFQGNTRFSGELREYCRRNGLPNLDREPLYAIAVAALNEQILLPRLLASLNVAIRCLSEPTEVVVVDNGSIDATPEIAESFGAKLIVENTRGIPVARSTALNNVSSSAKLVFSVDADAVVPRRWMKKYLDCFNRNDNLIFAYGDMIPMFDFSPARDQIASGAVIFLGNYMARLARIMRGVPMQPNSCNLVFNRSCAVEMGGYNRKIQAGEEKDLMNKLQHRGDVSYFPKMDVLTSIRRKMGMGLWAWIKFAWSKEFQNIGSSRPDGVYGIQYR